MKIAPLLLIVSIRVPLNGVVSFADFLWILSAKLISSTLLLLWSTDWFAIDRNKEKDITLKKTFFYYKCIGAITLESFEKWRCQVLQVVTRSYRQGERQVREKRRIDISNIPQKSGGKRYDCGHIRLYNGHLWQ